MGYLKPQPLLLFLLLPHYVYLSVFPVAFSKFDGTIAYVFTCKHKNTYFI